jgi:hypothetical protein
MVRRHDPHPAGSSRTGRSRTVPPHNWPSECSSACCRSWAHWPGQAGFEREQTIVARPVRSADHHSAMPKAAACPCVHQTRMCGLGGRASGRRGRYPAGRACRWIRRRRAARWAGRAPDSVAGCMILGTSRHPKTPPVSPGHLAGSVSCAMRSAWRSRRSRCRSEMPYWAIAWTGRSLELTSGSMILASLARTISPAPSVVTSNS